MERKNLVHAYRKAASKNEVHNLKIIRELDDDDAMEWEPTEALEAAVATGAIEAIEYLLANHEIGIKRIVGTVLKDEKSSDLLLRALIKADEFNDDMLRLLIQCKQPARVRSVLQWVQMENLDDPSIFWDELSRLIPQSPNVVIPMMETFFADPWVRSSMFMYENYLSDIAAPLQPYWLSFLVRDGVKEVPTRFLRSAWRQEIPDFPSADQEEWWIKGALLNGQSLHSGSCIPFCFQGDQVDLDLQFDENEMENSFQNLDFLACSVIGGNVNMMNKFYNQRTETEWQLMVYFSTRSGQYDAFRWLLSKSQKDYQPLQMYDIFTDMMEMWSWQSPLTPLLQIIEYILDHDDSEMMNDMLRDYRTVHPELLQILLRKRGHVMNLGNFLTDVVMEGGGVMLDTFRNSPHGGLSSLDWRIAHDSIGHRGWPKMKEKIINLASHPVKVGPLCSRYDCVECTPLAEEMNRVLQIFFPAVLVPMIMAYAAHSTN